LTRQRLVLRRLHEVHLVLAEAEPAHRAAEVGRGNALHPEGLAVEALGLVEVPARDADVVDPPRVHARDPSSGGVRGPARDAPLLLRRRAPERGLERLLERLAASDCEPSLAVGALESDADDHRVREPPQALTCMSAEARDLCHGTPPVVTRRSVAEAS